MLSTRSPVLAGLLALASLAPTQAAPGAKPKPPAQIQEEARLAAAFLGKPAPALRFSPIEGEAFDLADLRGEVVVLDFWATWCGDCVRAAPKLAALERHYAARGVRFLGISTDRKVPAEGVLAKARAFGHDFPQMMDHPAKAAATAYQVRWIPAMFVVDRAGIVQRIQLDLDRGGDVELAAVLDGLLMEGAGKGE